MSIHGTSNELRISPDNVGTAPSAASNLALANDAQMLEGVTDNFKKTILAQFTPTQRPVIERNWRVILDQARANIGAANDDPQIILSEKLDKLFLELQGIVVGVDPQGIKPWGEIEPKENEPARNTLKRLLHDLPLGCDFCSCAALNDFICNSSEESIQEMQTELRTLMQLLYAKTFEPGQKDNPVLEMLIGHVIALTAYIGNFQEGDLIQIPTKINGEWKPITYRTSTIALTPQYLAETVEAVAWIPAKEAVDASPILVFKPAQGLISVRNNWNPFADAAENFFRDGSRINNFFDQLDLSNRFGNVNKRVEVYGIGQGTNLAYRVAKERPGRVNFHAFSPVGLAYPRMAENAQGNTFMDPQDPVSHYGYIPVGGDSVRLIKVIRPDAPTSCLFGGDETLLLRVNTVYENITTQRYYTTLLHDIFALPLGILVAVVVGVQTLLYNIYYRIRLVVLCEPWHDPCEDNSTPRVLPYPLYASQLG